jgi:hypothetical protein
MVAFQTDHQETRQISPDFMTTIDYFSEAATPGPVPALKNLGLKTLAGPNI